jgi:Pyruvate/2-oxoacid:ferredoxin oxidoreductase gamma subunit
MYLQRPCGEQRIKDKSALLNADVLFYLHKTTTTTNTHRTKKNKVIRLNLKIINNDISLKELYLFRVKFYKCRQIKNITNELEINKNDLVLTK